MPGTQIKLLIVDDEAAMCESLSHIFIACGYRVGVAKDGSSALSQLLQELPDVILSDLYMPGISGFEFLAIVRRRFPTIRVIAMSGAFTGDSIPDGVAADSFYSKGTGVNALLKIMKALVTPAWVPRRKNFESRVTTTRNSLLPPAPKAPRAPRWRVREKGPSPADPE